MTLRDYLPVLVFFAIGLVVGGALLGASFLFRRKRRNKIKELPHARVERLVIHEGLFTGLVAARKASRTPLEIEARCGILATGAVRQRFSIDFYLTAMLFIVFDIELAFFYPLAVVLKSVGVAAVMELTLFVVVLGAGLAYVWRKGALEWR